MAKDDYLHSAIVNQKLAFARVELAAAVSQDGEMINAKLARHAHLDSAIAQLCDALAYFVVEVAEEYSLTLDPSLGHVTSLLAEFSSSGKQSAEIAELFALRKKPESWLSEVLSAKADPLFLARRFKNQSADAQTVAGVIPLVDVTQAASDSSGQSPLELVEGWARSAQGLVDRLRGSLHEE